MTKIKNFFKMNYLFEFKSLRFTYKKKEVITIREDIIAKRKLSINALEAAVTHLWYLSNIILIGNTLLGFAYKLISTVLLL